MNIREKLKQALAFFDQYEPVPSDDTRIYAVVEHEDHDNYHEFAHDNGVLCVGDLRDLLKELQA